MWAILYYIALPAFIMKVQSTPYFSWSTSGQWLPVFCISGNRVNRNGSRKNIFMYAYIYILVLIFCFKIEILWKLRFCSSFTEIYYFEGIFWIVPYWIYFRWRRSLTINLSGSIIKLKHNVHFISGPLRVYENGD